MPNPNIESLRPDPGSGNTKNIGSVTKIEQLVNGTGPFAQLGENVYDDYWMYYLTADMARSLEIVRPYTDLKSYIAYKQRGSETLQQFQDQIEQLSDEMLSSDQEEVE